MLHHNDRSRLAAFSRFVSIVWFTTGFPGALEVEATHFVALVLNREPFINSGTRAQRRCLDTSLTDLSINKNCQLVKQRNSYLPYHRLPGIRRRLELSYRHRHT